MEKRVIGVTGGIGCGKSAVMDILKEEYRAAVIFTDFVAHELMEPGGVNYRGVVETFGEQILGPDKKVDRKKLGDIVFGNQEKLALLNAATHPNVVAEVKKRLEEYRKDPKVGMVCLESALLLDTPLEGLCDAVWYIRADKDVRIKRLMKSRGYSEKHCTLVMEKQSGESLFLKKADKVIDNSKSIEDTKRQIALAIEERKSGVPADTPWRGTGN